MKIAIVNWTSRHVGGAETYIRLVVPALRRIGHDVFFWHEHSRPIERDAIVDADVPSCDASAVGIESALQQLKHWAPDVLFVHRVTDPSDERALLAIVPAILFAHDYYGTCISGAKTTRMPVVQPCQRRFGPACLLSYYPRRCGGLNPVTMAVEYRRQASRLANLRHYCGVTTFSEHMRREYVKHDVPEHLVHRLPPIGGACADVELPREQIRGSHLVFIGRIDRLKGCRTLVEALPAVRASVKGRIVVTIAGDGPDLAFCREAARTAASRLPDTSVEFIGWVARTRCDALLRSADVLVLPSLWPEPFGLSGLDAARRGVPVAAFAVGGIPEWLEDGTTGALAPAAPPTARGLASAIVRCLTNPAIRQSAREWASRQQRSNPVQPHLDALLPVLESAAASLK